MEAAETNILDERTGQVQEPGVAVLDEKLRELLDALKNIPEGDDSARKIYLEKLRCETRPNSSHRHNCCQRFHRIS